MGILGKIKGWVKSIFIHFNLISDISSNTEEFSRRIRSLTHNNNEETNALIALIKRGINVNEIKRGIIVSQTKIYGGTPVHETIVFGNIRILEALLDAKPNFNVQNDQGITALHLASLYKKTEMVKLLLSENANPNIQSNAGTTPLHCVTQWNPTNALATIKLLLDKNAIIDTKTNQNQTLLSLTASHRNSAPVFKPLLKMLLDTIKNRLKDNKFGAIENKNQLFDEINNHFGIKHESVDKLIEWLINNNNETRDNMLKYIETLYSRFQKTGAFSSHRLRDRLLDAIDPNALLFSKTTQVEPNAPLTVGAGPCAVRNYLKY